MPGGRSGDFRRGCSSFQTPPQQSPSVFFGRMVLGLPCGFCLLGPTWDLCQSYEQLRDPFRREALGNHSGVSFCWWGQGFGGFFNGKLGKEDRHFGGQMKTRLPSSEADVELLYRDHGIAGAGQRCGHEHALGLSRGWGELGGLPDFR